MRRGDIFVLCIVLALAGVFALPRLLSSRPGQLLVTAGESEIAYALHENMTEQIRGVVFEIKDGRARIASSPCRDQLCVKAGWLARPGDAAICLPQRVVLRVQGVKSGVDGVAY